jgi:hypothetical protein
MATYLEWEPAVGATGQHPRDAAYRCELHGGTCAVVGCGAPTVVHPVCYAHASSVLGIELRPTPSHGCGLFATRAFRKRQLIAPYIGHLVAGKRTRVGGRERVAFDLTCPDAVVRPGYHRTVSPYAVDFSARQVVDATCMRSWASMANHGPTPKEQNAELVRYNVLHDGFVRVPSRGNNAVLQYKDRRHYIFPEVLEHVDPGRLHLGMLCVWLKATRDIAAGKPILLNYTPRTLDGYGSSEMARVVHRTVGSLCPVAPPPVATASGETERDEEDDSADGAAADEVDLHALDAVKWGLNDEDNPWNPWA